MNFIKKLRLYAAALLLLATQIVRAGQPTLEVVLSVSLPNGNQVSLYGDSGDDKVLYFMPARLQLKRQSGGGVMCDIMAYRGVSRIVPTPGAINEVEVGTLNGGVMDAVLELTGPTRDLEELRAALRQQYPRYGDYRLAMVPITPGSAAVVFSQKDLFPNDPVDQEGPNSGGPTPVSISGELGAAIPCRFRFSHIDAQILIEKVGKASQNDAFVSAFDVAFSAQVRMNIPKTTISIVADESRIYELTEQHFKSKGGIFFFSYAADIHKISQKLKQEGALTIKINNQNPEMFKPEMLQAIADQWLENFVLKLFNQNNLEIPGDRAAALSAPKRKFWPWSSIGASFASMKVRQNISKKVSFTFEYEGVQEMPLQCVAEFTGIGPRNITHVDLNNGYFTYNRLAVLPPPAELLYASAFGDLNVQITVKGQNGATTTRSCVFNRYQRDPYITVMPLVLDMSQDPATGMMKAQCISEVTYTMRYSGRTAEFSVQNLKANYSSWEFDMPAINVAEHLTYIRISMSPDIFDTYPRLAGVRISIPGTNGKPATTLNLNPNQQSAFYIYEPRKAPPEVDVTAIYENGTQFIYPSEKKPLTPEAEWQLASYDIPEILTHGKR